MAAFISIEELTVEYGYDVFSYKQLSVSESVSAIFMSLL